MAPIRRYLRITKYSVLECRIYLDNPGLAYTWLLNPRDPVLPRVIESIRPLVLPKLLEEKERARRKSTKKKGGIKDVVVEDDFEVSIFLTETDTRHSLLYKHKHFRDKTQTKLVSNAGNKLTGASRDAPVDVDGIRDLQIRLEDDDEQDATIPRLRREESEDEGDGVGGLALEDIPAIGEEEEQGEEEALGRSTRRSKRPRRQRATISADESNEGEEDSDFQEMEGAEDGALREGEDDDDGIFVLSEPPRKRARKTAAAAAAAAAENSDNKKKLAMDISYEGFAIYGRVLCLVIKRRDAAAAAGSRGASGGGRSQASSSSAAAAGAAAATGGAAGGQAMMENWIASTQMPAALGEEADVEA